MTNWLGRASLFERLLEVHFNLSRSLRYIEFMEVSGTRKLQFIFRIEAILDTLEPHSPTIHIHTFADAFGYLLQKFVKSSGRGDRYTVALTVLTAKAVPSG